MANTCSQKNQGSCRKSNSPQKKYEEEEEYLAFLDLLLASPKGGKEGREGTLVEFVPSLLLLLLLFRLADTLVLIILSKRPKERKRS